MSVVFNERECVFDDLQQVGFKKDLNDPVAEDLSVCNDMEQGVSVSNDFMEQDVNVSVGQGVNVCNDLGFFQLTEEDTTKQQQQGVNGGVNVFDHVQEINVEKDLDAYVVQGLEQGVDVNSQGGNVSNEQDVHVNVIQGVDMCDDLGFLQLLEQGNIKQQQGANVVVGGVSVSSDFAQQNVHVDVGQGVNICDVIFPQLMEEDSIKQVQQQGVDVVVNEGVSVFNHMEQVKLHEEDDTEINKRKRGRPRKKQWGAKDLNCQVVVSTSVSIECQSNVQGDDKKRKRGRKKKNNNNLDYQSGVVSENAVGVKGEETENITDCENANHDGEVLKTEGDCAQLLLTPGVCKYVYVYF